MLKNVKPAETKQKIMKTCICKRYDPGFNFFNYTLVYGICGVFNILKSTDLRINFYINPQRLKTTEVTELAPEGEGGGRRRIKL